MVVLAFDVFTHSDLRYVISLIKVQSLPSCLCASPRKCAVVVMIMTTMSITTTLRTMMSILMSVEGSVVEWFGRWS